MRRLIDFILLLLLGFLIWKGMAWLNQSPYSNRFVDMRSTGFSYLDNFQQKAVLWTKTQEDLNRLQDTNTVLKLENEKLLAENRDLQYLKVENTELRRKLQFVQLKQDVWLPAEIKAYAPGHWQKEIIINKGKSHGITYGSPVITAQGLVGLVEQVGENSATVRLITHSDVRVSVVSEKNQMIAVAEGTGTHELHLKYAGTDVPWEVGDLYYTSSFSQYYPKGIPVGRVKKVVKDPKQMFADVQLEPVVKFETFDYVLVKK
jgi:rod shape-determining protein MreC